MVERDAIDNEIEWRKDIELKNWFREEIATLLYSWFRCWIIQNLPGGEWIGG